MRLSLKRPLSSNAKGLIVGSLALSLSLTQSAWAQTLDVGTLASIGSISRILQQVTGGGGVGGSSSTSDGGSGFGSDDGLGISQSGQPQEELFSTSPSSQARSKVPEASQVLMNYFCQGIDISADKLTFLMKVTTAVERDYCQRAGTWAPQYGYDILFGRSARSKSVMQTDEVADDYIVGDGDYIGITTAGGYNQTGRFKVDSAGYVTAFQLPPIFVSGSTAAEVKQLLEDKINEAFVTTNILINILPKQVIKVQVAGEVGSAGVIRTKANASVVDVLLQAGGINKTGSLRRIRVHRGAQVFWVDLYELIGNSGMPQMLQIENGDRIVVPSLGKTAAVMGGVARPGIYELPEGVEQLSVEEALELAGGEIRPQGNRLMKLIVTQTGGQETHEVAREGEQAVSAGDILFSQPQTVSPTDFVVLEGHVRQPLRLAVNSAPTVADLLMNIRNIGPDPYLPFGVLQTIDPRTRSRQLVGINLQQVMAGEKNYRLRGGDRLIILSREDLKYLASAEVQSIIRGIPLKSVEITAVNDKGEIEGVTTTNRDANAAKDKKVTSDKFSVSRFERFGAAEQGVATVLSTSKSHLAAFTNRCGGLDRVAEIVATAGVSRFVRAQRYALVKQDITSLNPRTCPQVFYQYPEVLPFLLDNVVVLNGEVRNPGIYPTVQGTDLQTLVYAAGGLSRNSDLKAVEISKDGLLNQRGDQMVNLEVASNSSVLLNPGDAVRFNSKYSTSNQGAVELSGQFKYPGIYQIGAGDKVSTLIARAGGLTPKAYPYGAILTRERVRLQEAEGLRTAIREFQFGLMMASTRSENDSAAALDDIAKRLDKLEAVGRIVAELDPTVLKMRPDLDIDMESQDKLFMPVRPASVMVLGDVLRPTAIQFRPGVNTEQYVAQAGGLQETADEEAVFVVYPNGEAHRIGQGNWDYNETKVPPGSTIVVPREPVPTDTYGFLEHSMALLSTIAVTTASIKVLRD